MKCQICGKELSNPKSASHVDSNFHRKAMGLPPKEKKKTKRTTGGDARIVTLERQMIVVLQKLSAIEEKISIQNSSYQNTGPIKSKIINLMRGQKSLDFDHLHGRLREYKWRDIEIALNELVDEEMYDLAEGRSNKKLEGRYARIIKR